jgi:hypothetical protein
MDKHHLSIFHKLTSKPTGGPSLDPKSHSNPPLFTPEGAAGGPGLIGPNKSTRSEHCRGGSPQKIREINFKVLFCHSNMPLARTPTLSGLSFLICLF